MIQKAKENRTAIVFGAGFVGSRLCLRLEHLGFGVIKTVRNEKELKKIPTEQTGCSYAVQVAKENEVRLFAKRIKNKVAMGETGKIRTVIYTAGNYPKDGAAKEKSSRSKLPISDIFDEVCTQIFGPDIVFSYMLPLLEDSGSFIFTSSLAHDNLKHNLVVPEQWEHTINDMRKDEEAVARGIRVHHIASGPTDTHYYNDENRPERVLPVSLVIDKIVSLIGAEWNTSERINEPE